MIWHYVPTGENSVDIRSRGGNINHNNLWKHGPPWLSVPAQWPAQGALESTPESQIEVHSLQKVLRITAWVGRFITNCRRGNCRKEDCSHMDSHEVQEQREWWIRCAQNTVRNDQQFHVDRQQLNLQENILCTFRTSIHLLHL